MITVRRIIAAVAVAIAFAGSAGSALAGEFNVNRHGTYVRVPSASTQTPGLSGQAVSPTIVRISDGSGFDWGDAGIGAGAGVAIAVIVLGGGLALSQRRSGEIRHPEGQAGAMG